MLNSELSLAACATPLMLGSELFQVTFWAGLGAMLQIFSCNLYMMARSKDVVTLQDSWQVARCLARCKMLETFHNIVDEWLCDYLSAYARQPARGPTMLAHLVAICWPMLASCWPMWSQKIRKMGTAKKRCKTQDILMVGGLSWGYVGPSWGYVGLSWGQCGPILGLCWPILGPCWPILGLCWPILGLCWPILGAMLAHLGAMLAHLGGYVGPSWGLCWPMLTHLEPQDPKNGKKWDEHETP